MNVRIYTLLWTAVVLLATQIAAAQLSDETQYHVIPLGQGGQHKMLYDRRQRPQAVLAANKLHLVYNGGTPPNVKNIARTMPFALTYDLETGQCSDPFQLPGTASRDHHYGPIIWADAKDRLHVLSGCHKTPGTHVVSKSKAGIGKSEGDWQIARPVAPSLSYPSASQIYDSRTLIYYRTGEHRSSWTYSISNPNCTAWQTPEYPVVDLNDGGELADVPHTQMDEASSYHTYLPGKDGRSLHIAFIYYDDNKGHLPEKSYNPRYGGDVGTLKTNLYYVKVDLLTGMAYNFEGRHIETPITLDDADAHCRIWDTGWRGAGVPPDILIDRRGNPAFLHVLTENTVHQLNYYYVHRVEDRWEQVVIAPACHKWNSSHLMSDQNGVLHAFLPTTDGSFDSKGKGPMNNHGGGTRVEEWTSEDEGRTWKKHRTLLTAEGRYRGWRFNNVQPVRTTSGEIREGLLLCYGWKDGEASHAQAFVMVRDDHKPH